MQMFDNFSSYTFFFIQNRDFADSFLVQTNHKNGLFKEIIAHERHRDKIET